MCPWPWALAPRTRGRMLIPHPWHGKSPSASLSASKLWHFRGRAPKTRPATALTPGDTLELVQATKTPCKPFQIPGPTGHKTAITPPGWNHCAAKSLGGEAWGWGVHMRMPTGHLQRAVSLGRAGPPPKPPQKKRTLDFGKDTDPENHVSEKSFAPQSVRRCRTDLADGLRPLQSRSRTAQIQASQGLGTCRRRRGRRRCRLLLGSAATPFGFQPQAESCARDVLARAPRASLRRRNTRHLHLSIGLAFAAVLGRRNRQRPSTRCETSRAVCIGLRLGRRRGERKHGSTRGRKLCTVPSRD